MVDDPMLEGQFLGLLLRSSDPPTQAIRDVLSRLDQGRFRVEANRLIYTAIQELISTVGRADLVSVYDLLSRNQSLSMSGNGSRLAELWGLYGQLEDLPMFVDFFGIGSPMAEQEWIACGEPEEMLCSLHNEVSDRKLRLFSVACCRRILHLLPDSRSRRAVEIAERYADGAATLEELGDARKGAMDAYAAFHEIEPDVPPAGNFAPLVAAFRVADPPRFAPSLVARCVLYGNHDFFSHSIADLEVLVPPERAVQVQLLRCVVGNPSRPSVCDATWLTSTVVSIAKGIYTDCVFDRMSILADALQDAGCSNEEVLNHCRGTGPHVRGCWVVDLLLGKE